MQGLPQSKPAKRLGDLLLESGIISEPDLLRAVEISKKNFQSLGKVLVSSKICKEQDINNALEVQKLCKLEHMTGSIAVRVLIFMKKDYLSSTEALHRVGWTHPTYKSFQEPQDVAAAKAVLKGMDVNSIAYAKALEKVGDSYDNNKLPARAEVQFEKAVDVYEKCLPESALDMSHLLSKLGRLAVHQKRHNEAKEFLEKAQKCLEGAGHKQSKEYVKVLHVSAEYNVARRKFSEAEQHYIESFNLLEPQYGLEDEHVLETLRAYVETMQKSSRDPEQCTLGDLLKGAKLLTEAQLEAGAQESRNTKLALGRALVVNGSISEKVLQSALQAQLLVRNGEITTQLGVWIVLYVAKLDKAFDDVLELFNCQTRSRSHLAGELRSASNEMQNMESRLPANHPDLAFAHAKVAHIYYQRQQWVESDHHYKRALTIFSASPNAYTERALDVIDQYGDLKSTLDDLEEAVRIAKIATQMRGKHFGHISIPFAKGLEKLAAVYCSKGDHRAAVGCLSQALEVREKLYGPDDKQLLGCLEAKGDAQEHVQDYQGAEETFERALKIADEVYGQAHDVTERLTRKLVDACQSAGNVGKVKELAPGSWRDNPLM
jgi:tetratricopeptide (TPR) repeat protein